jgi:23S rRNA (adenine2503-C2)-methyltransferase
LAEEDLPVTLAISLHAPTDTLRRELIGPSARPVAEVLAAARAYYASRHREVTLEYVLIEGVNDTPACIEALGEIARGLRCNVNVIRYNPVSASSFRRPQRRSAEGFVERLRAWGVNAHLRRSRGLDADAACGQLRRRVRDDVEDRHGSQTGSNDRSQEVR